jgi:hypothetical protein
MARNLLTDVAGIAVGHATDRALGSGVTAIIFIQPFIASVATLGGACWATPRPRSPPAPSPAPSSPPRHGSSPPVRPPGVIGSPRAEP